MIARWYVCRGTDGLWWVESCVDGDGRSGRRVLDPEPCASQAEAETAMAQIAAATGVKLGPWETWHLEPFRCRLADDGEVAS